MGTITKQFQYALDVTGRLPANRIAEEHHTLTKPNWRTYHFIVPRCAPYFNLNVSVIHVDNSGNRRELREGVDWVPSYYFIGASRACAAPVYGGISFLNMNLVGQIIISYNTLGGEWVLDGTGLAQVLANYKLNPLITTWEQIANVPKVFPPEPHEWDLVDMVGEKEVVEAIYDIANAIRRKNGTSGSGNANTELNNHLNDKDNPHEVNKQQVGLGNVANYTIVPLTQAAESEANDLYTTPASVRAIIENAVGKALKAHIENKNNPHEVDTYTKREIDNALAGKVGTSGTAYDTERFKGKSYTELKAEVVEELKQILPSANLTAEDLRKITNEAIKEVKKAADLNAVTLENKSLEQVLTAAADRVKNELRISNNYRFGIATKSVKGYTEEEKGAGKTYTVSKEVAISLDTTNTSTTYLLTYPTVTSNDTLVPITEKLVLNLTTPNSGQLANAVETADSYLHELTVITKGIAGTGVTELNKVGVVLNGKVTNPVDVNIHSSENMFKVRVLLTKTEDSNTRAATILEATAQQIVL